MRSHSVIEARLKFSPRESRLEVRQKNTLPLLISTFSGPPCGEYRDDGSLSMIRIPHGRMIAATYRAYNTRTRAHIRSSCRPEKERDTTKWRATGVWTLRAVKVVAYFTSWLRETFSSCRSCVHARTESGGALSIGYTESSDRTRRLLRVNEIQAKNRRRWLRSSAAEHDRAIC